MSMNAITKVIACNLTVIVALDRQYKFTSDKEHNLWMEMPVEGVGSVQVRVEECIFMPDEVFVRFDSLKEFNHWKIQKEALAKLCLNGKLTKENV